MLRSYAESQTTMAAGGGSVVVNADGTVSIVGETDFSADILLVSGAAIKWDTDDVTWTHSAGKLTLGGDGDVEIDFANHEMTNVDIDNFRESFDRTDKDKVREHLTMNRYNAEQAALAHQWLHDLEEERATRDR